MSFLIIGITGEMGSGKDTVANIINNEFNLVRLAFADSIKRGVCAMFNIPIDDLNDRSIKEIPHPRLCGRTPRYVMQVIGTELGRNLIADDIWLRTLQYQIEFAKENFIYGGAVISDVRFENEVDMIKSMGGKIIHIVREDNPFKTSMNHASEKGGLYNDFIIYNNSDIDDLRLNTLNLMKSINKIQ